MDTAIKTLREGCHSLVVVLNGVVRAFDGRGVSDLYHLYTTAPETLRGALVADKVVGKGAAALMVLGGVAVVHAEVISRPALSMLEAAGIEATHGTLVPHIANRAGTGMCPLESRCLPCATAAECMVQIDAFVREMRAHAAKQA